MPLQTESAAALAEPLSTQSMKASNVEEIVSKDELVTEDNAHEELRAHKENGYFPTCLTAALSGMPTPESEWLVGTSTPHPSSVRKSSSHHGAETVGFRLHHLPQGHC